MAENDAKLPYSPACDRNKEAILDILDYYALEGANILEIGSGTGQHIVYFSKQLPDTHWTATDVPSNHLTIKKYIRQAKCKNVDGPFAYTAGVDKLPPGRFDIYFSANTLHIMSWKEVKTLFKDLGKKLNKGNLVLFYGPFNYENKYTSDSNCDFDIWLKENNAKSGIRNFETIVESMNSYEFKFIDDHEMPANNRILVFQKTTSGQPSKLRK